MVDPDETLVEPVILDELADADLPLRGPIRQRVVEQARDSARQRRTVEAVSDRIASGVSEQVAKALQRQLKEAIQDTTIQLIDND